MSSSRTPNLENLRKQAKTLLRSWQQGEPDALDRVSVIFPNEPSLGLQDAQFVLAREYGFRSWYALLDYAPRLGHFDDIANFRISREFEVSSERLWSAVSEPDEIGVWLLPVSFEPKVGSSYAFRSQPAMTGTLGEYEIQRSIRFDGGHGAFWRFTMDAIDSEAVRMRLTVEDRMTLESVEQFPGGVTEVWNPGVTSGWHEILDALEHHLTKEQPPNIDYPRLCKFYERALEQLKR